MSALPPSQTSDLRASAVLRISGGRSSCERHPAFSEMARLRYSLHASRVAKMTLVGSRLNVRACRSRPQSVVA